MNAEFCRGNILLNARDYVLAALTVMFTVLRNVTQYDTNFTTFRLQLSYTVYGYIFRNFIKLLQSYMACH